MVSKRSHKKISRRKTKKVMRGGSACAAARNATQTGGSACAAARNATQTGGSACAAARNATQTGGSLASSFVEDYANLNAQKQPVDEYTTKMGLPSMDNLKGGGCGCNAVMRGGKRSIRRRKTQRGGSACAAARNATQTGGSACAAARNATQSGGSAAANNVMGNVSEMKAPNMYQLTGGSKKGRKTKRVKPCKQRGGSFWNFAGYGNINAGPAMFKNDHYFTKDTSHPSWKDLMDPPTKEKAGSGDKQDLAVGASYPFK